MPMSRIFFDTNIFLHTLLAETECVSCTRLLSKWREIPGVEEAVASCLSFANIAYILRKQAGKEKVAPSINALLNYVSRLTPNTEEEYSAAFMLRGPDYEDILQYVNAWMAGCSTIITTNGKDFRRISDPEGVLGEWSPEILSPEEYLHTALENDAGRAAL